VIRVLWLIKGLGPGGAEHLLVAAASARDREACSVRAAYLLPWKDALVGPLEAHGVRVECFGVRDERDLRWLGRLRGDLERDPVDVVHVHSPYVAAMTRLVVRTLPKRVRPAIVTTEHNAWSRFKAPTRFANAWTARLDAATIAVSEETRDSMSAVMRARTEVVVHGIDVDAVRQQRTQRDEVRAELGVDDGTVLVGTVANYHPKKDWPNLLQAARLVADQTAPGAVRFVAVGQGPLQAEVEALHHTLALDGVVTLTGHRPDAVRLMAGCDVFVLASQWEGLPVAIMEALALGLPIVATAVGGVAETFMDGVDARLVPPHDPAALAKAIIEVAADPDERGRLAAASSARAGEFDARRTEEHIESIYARVVAASRR
jgi:glycosyltransferase involved in cell wall biosynthesis